MRSIQLKLATGKRFRTVFGPSFAVADDLDAVNTASSGLPKHSSGGWGHVPSLVRLLQAEEP